MMQGYWQFDGYNIADFDIDDPTVVVYVGLITKSGAWVIKEYDMVTGAVGYIRGDTDYAASWVLRAGLSYGTYNDVF